MAASMVSLGELAPVLVTEARRRMLTLGTLFAVIALAALVLGATWPKKYESSTTILVQESNIVTGLMEGRAVATTVADRASIAREVIFSRKVMGEILVIGGWMAKQPTPSPIEQDRMIESITNRTKIASPRDNLIEITYSDGDAERSFKITQRLAELFIQESLAAKERESRNAFDFINGQVESYHAKLTDAEDKLKAYREANVDARPGGEADSNARISQLRGQVEQARMEAMEQHSREGALVAQVSGESEVTAVQTRAGQIRVQLAELQGELDKLLLTYTEGYPDVVRVRHQIQDLQESLQRDEAQKSTAKATSPSAIDNTVQYNPLYQELRSKLNEARRNSGAIASRMGASQSMLNDELERSKRIANSENALSELTRDYEVNREIYQDLLKRRENARVSMELDQKQQGLTFRIQEPAVMPLRPSGLRLMHFAMAGLGLGIVLPLGLLFGYARFDPRVRSAAQIERMAGVPVLATIPVYATPADRRRNIFQATMLVAIIAAVGVAYAAMYWIRLEVLP
jgi:polysaccharide chain length determinant protein (PEP-CTERM system associated)